MPGVDVTPGLNRPKDNALRQQRLKDWKPILDPRWVVAALAIIAIIFIPVGFKLRSMANSLVELKQVYDAYNDPSPPCGINRTANAGYLTGKQCQIEFEVPQDMEPPILVHYEVTGFYQNQRRYVNSRDDAQLLGATTQTDLAISKCRPLAKLGNITINPCGLVANTLFNDVFNLVESEATVDVDGVPLAMIEEGIAWQSDLEFKFRQPEGFYSQQCSSCDDANCTCDSKEWSCSKLGPYKDKDGNCFLYYYPNDDTTQYLYETYPMVIDPIKGVTNEHFIVWMRTAALPDFRKLYGWIDQPIAAGTKLTFNVQPNFEVASFKGSKALVVSNNNIFGGRNTALGNNFIIVGLMALGFSLFFGLKHAIRPRKIADKNYLYFKEE